MGSDGDYPAEALGPGVQVDGYLVDRVLGRGGFGIVYAASDAATGDRVAIKVLSLARDSELVSRCMDEAQAADALGHRAIVDLKGFGELDDGTTYMVSELLVGEPLSARLARDGYMAPGEVVAVLAELALALGLAHDNGVVHRDLQPANIFMVDDAGRHRPVILDFGMVRLISKKDRVQQGRTGEVHGTPQFMAPEQTRGEDGDARADIYALGAMAYQMLVGKPPYQGPNSFATLMLHMSAPIPSAWQENPALPEAIDAAFEILLAKQPEERPASVAAAVELLRKALGLTTSPTGIGQDAAAG
jgi:serine/threonine-protein kinase